MFLRKERFFYFAIWSENSETLEKNILHGCQIFNLCVRKKFSTYLIQKTIDSIIFFRILSHRFLVFVGKTQAVFSKLFVAFPEELLEITFVFIKINFCFFKISWKKDLKVWRTFFGTCARTACLISIGRLRKRINWKNQRALFFWKLREKGSIFRQKKIQEFAAKRLVRIETTVFYFSEANFREKYFSGKRFNCMRIIRFEQKSPVFIRKSFSILVE